jgi:hypothetical protein
MDAAAKITEIGLARSPCYGTCPVYSLTLRRDGKAVFVGEHFVDMLGEHNARFDSSDFGTLALAVAQLRFGNLRRHYQVDYTDMPTTMTWLIQSARRRTVEDYGDAGPRRLRQIEGLIDDAAADLTWDVVVALNADSGGCGHIGDAGGDSWLPDPEPHEHPHWTQMRNASER